MSANEAKPVDQPATMPPPIREPSGWVAPGAVHRATPPLPLPLALPSPSPAPARMEPMTFEPLPPVPGPDAPGPGLSAPASSGSASPPPPEPAPLNPDEYAPYRVKLTGTRDAPPPGVYSPGQSPRIRRRNRIVALLAVLILAVVGIAIGLAVSDSGSGPNAAVTPGTPPSQNINDPQKILTDASQTALAEGSFQVVATSSAPGQLSRVDVFVGIDGGTGTIELNGATFKVVAVGQTLYVQGDAASLVTIGLSRTGAEKYAGTWIEITRNDGVLTPYFYLFNIQEVTQGLLLLGPPLSAIGTSAQPMITVNGYVTSTPLVPATAVGDRATVTVSNDSPYLPLQVSFAGTARGLYVYTFSDWNVTVQPSPPAGAVRYTTARAA